MVPDFYTLGSYPLKARSESNYYALLHDIVCQDIVALLNHRKHFKGEIRIDKSAVEKA